MNNEPRVVFIQDALPFIGGAERALEALVEVFHDAPIYTLVYNKESFLNSPISRQEVRTSFIQRLPGSRTLYRYYLPLFPLAIEQFDLSDFDIIVSLSYAVAHGVLTRPDQLHISYVFTPLRHTWHYYHQFLREVELSSSWRSWVARIILHYVRMWGSSAALRTDQFIASSNWVAKGVWRAYRRHSQVIYPPVDIGKFKPLSPKGDYYITVSRLALHKRISLVIEAFSKLKLPLLIVGVGEEYRRLRKMATPNIEFLGWLTEARLQELLGRAKAFVHAAEEDFGIALVEAQAAGCPVIAYSNGGAAETVISGKTGILFSEQTVDGIVSAVREFERHPNCFDQVDLLANASRFRKDLFQKQFLDSIKTAWESFSKINCLE